MVLVRVALILVAAATTVAGLLGAVAGSLPDAIPSQVPAVCVHPDLPAGGNLQAGYCP